MKRSNFAIFEFFNVKSSIWDKATLWLVLEYEP